ncbi:MAG: selenide, water dikinase SelD [Alphaproteobacteria bacterium]|jgi:selenide,water dikinase|nr:selenide, water dikinase SelD [Rhodospirillaceae bacterium]MDP6405745.1 selenide, water dikinase SelD [Alphaproteobacteria bacterium]MDP6623782.1 selenide, water dikinase SelD [Alphaproteobacteria bacterium]
MDDQVVRLTTLSHGGGCGCKIAPGVLGELLDELPASFRDPALLVGTETGDDAAVYQINDHQTVVATTDFFMPIVDDPFDFGRIAATNALSDVYAVGAKPILALALVGMPIDKLPLEIIRNILAGGAVACAEAGVAIAGGHSIDAPEPIYGLAAVGLGDPATIKRNIGAQAGDVLILGKPLGVGILSAALQKGALDATGYGEMITTTTKLNAIGADLASRPGIHAMTDVTGFGLLGHLLEVCRGSELGAVVKADDLPLLPTARALAESGTNTGAAGRNWNSYGHEVTLATGLQIWRKNLLCDPQTSGGLLVSVAADEAEATLALFHDQGYEGAAVIGHIETGPARVRVV